jgi:hypothetical protein
MDLNSEPVLDAITVGNDMLMRILRSGSRHLVLITNLEASVELDEEFMNGLVGHMKLHSITLEVRAVST